MKQYFYPDPIIDTEKKHESLLNGIQAELCNHSKCDSQCDNCVFDSYNIEEFKLWCKDNKRWLNKTIYGGKK